MRIDLHDCIALLGVALIIAGVFRWSVTAGLIAFGAALIVGSLLDVWTRKPVKGKES